MGVANRQHHHVKRVRLDEQGTSIRLYNPLIFCISRGTTCYAVSSDLTVCMACSDPAMIQAASHSSHYRTALNETDQLCSAPPVACSPLANAVACQLLQQASISCLFVPLTGYSPSFKGLDKSGNGERPQFPEGWAWSEGGFCVWGGGGYHITWLLLVTD